MDVNKKRVLKYYIKKDAEEKYITLVEKLPLNSVIILEKYDGICFVLRISYFTRKDLGFFAGIYAVSSPNIDSINKMSRYIFQNYIPLYSIKCWKLWTPSFAPLTINWTMSNWYMTLAFGK